MALRSNSLVPSVPEALASAPATASAAPPAAAAASMSLSPGTALVSRPSSSRAIVPFAHQPVGTRATAGASGVVAGHIVIASWSSDDSGSKKGKDQRIPGSRAFFIPRRVALPAFGLSISTLFGAPVPPAHAGGGGGGGGGGSGSKPAGRKTPITLTLVSYAVTKKAYEKITKQFSEKYLKETGQDVRFRLSFGGSGTQARAVIDGLPADVVALALPLDLMKIVDAGLIATDWQQRLPNRAVVSTSVVTLVTRIGNPKAVKDWKDLTKPGVQVITANPKTAGVARWNFLGLWGSTMAKGDAAAIKFVEDVFSNVPVQPRDAREASDVFYKQNIGDVLLTYENEVILTNEMYASGKGGGKALPYVVPQNNVMVESPVAVVDKNVDKKGPETRAAAEAFTKYLFTPNAQREFAACGFRTIDKAVPHKLPAVANIWTVDQKLGGWKAAQTKFFNDRAILDNIQTKVAKSRKR